MITPDVIQSIAIGGFVTVLACVAMLTGHDTGVLSTAFIILAGLAGLVGFRIGKKKAK